MSRVQALRDHDRLRVLWLRERFGWMGRHSGYDRLFAELEGSADLEGFSVYREVDEVFRPPVRQALSLLRRVAGGTEFYTNTSAKAELRVLFEAARRRSRMVHFAYGENALGLVRRFGRRRPWRLVVTAHCPPAWWEQSRSGPGITRGIDALIAVSETQRAYFDAMLPGRVHLVRHGVDASFFRPPSEEPASGGRAPRCLFAGGWLRDAACLAHVVAEASRRAPEVWFDLLVPEIHRAGPAYAKLLDHPRVRWHAGLDDEALLALYRQTSLLLLPLLDCTANNAVLEAMACGLPIVASDVGAMREYVDPEFADLIAPGDIDGFVDAVLRLAEDPGAQRRRGLVARRHAETRFAWSDAAHATLGVYENVVSR